MAELVHCRCQIGFGNEGHCKVTDEGRVGCLYRLCVWAVRGCGGIVVVSWHLGEKSQYPELVFPP